MFFALPGSGLQDQHNSLPHVPAIHLTTSFLYPFLAFTQRKIHYLNVFHNILAKMLAHIEISEDKSNKNQIGL